MDERRSSESGSTPRRRFERACTSRCALLYVGIPRCPQRRRLEIKF